MRMRTVLALIILVLGAAVAGYLARPHLNDWQSPNTGAVAKDPGATPAGAAAPKYQCSMHPQIVSDRPGICPICQMKLQRVDEPAAATDAHSAGAHAPLFYRHPMRPDVTSPHPAKDEMGMDYIPVYEEDAPETSSVAGRAGFKLSTARQQLIGVTRAPVERRRLDSDIRAVGMVAYDPTLYQAIVEYREALDTKHAFGANALPEARDGANGIARAAALRLRQLGLSEQQLREIAETGRSPVDLLLPGKNAWVYAQVYEYEMSAVHPGQAVTITTPSQRQRTYEGRVVAVDPIIDTKTRTARVRVHVPTPDASLRPEGFVHATIHVPSDEVLTVPADAVLLGGHEQIVFVIRDEGTFVPRAVQLGREANGYYEVLGGVVAGEDVVTSANFLIDSESRFRAALTAFAPKTPEGAAQSAPERGSETNTAPQRPPGS
jgi:hypothetical protein